VRELRAELGWLGGALGPVRDLDVLVEHLRADAGALGGEDEGAFLTLILKLEAERAADRDALLAVLADPRYIALVERLDADTRAPPAARSDRTLRDLAGREFRRLRKAMRALGAHPADDELHAARIAVKRARYAAELAERPVGRGATAFIREAKVLQDVLGDHQDAAVAEARIRALVGARAPAGQAIAAGRVIERQHERRRAARAEYPKAWRDLERRADGVLV
jgi:CHAD domain-containing protein